MANIRTQLQIANDSFANAMTLIAMLRAARG
jgi:hypothetical protein